MTTKLPQVILPPQNLEVLRDLYDDAMRHLRFNHPRAKAHLDQYFEAVDRAVSASIKT